MQRCKALVTAVEILSQTEVNEMFKLIHQRHTMYTRNNNGVFLNLTWIDEETLCALENYVSFCNQSRSELLKFESICDVLNSKNHFTHAEHAKEKAQQKETDKLGDVSRTTRLNWSAEAVVPKPDVAEQIDIDMESEESSHTSSSFMKVSSSTRFALFKKKFAKQWLQNNMMESQENENYLKPDQYLCI